MSEPIIFVKQGRLLGKIKTDVYNNDFYSFQGIPYAKAPLSNLRFKAPQPPESWQGTRNATEDSSECYSRNMISQTITGSEDCLFLNVYTPKLSDDQDSSLLPVMVWIHGGGFRQGSNKSDLYGPEYLITADVVVVAINYRLGILGFLSLEDESLEVPGNAGLKDMVMALQWIQENITSFSGDPDNVTIFGESAGSAAVHYLVLSPLAKGLFHKGILQSGCALCPFTRGRTDLAKIIASVLNLSNPSDMDILQILQNLPVDKLFELSEQVYKRCDPLNNTGKLRVYAPVIESSSPGAFLTEDPITIIKSCNYNKVPLIFGYNTSEGILIEMMIKPKKPTMPNFESLIPFWLNLEPGSDESKSMADKIKQFYYKSGDTDSLECFHQLFTDNYFVRDILCATQNHALSSSEPVYLYRMSVETRLNLFKRLSGTKGSGVAHGDDIGYLFKPKAFSNMKLNETEELAIKRFVTFWTNFAKYGNPNSPVKSDVIQWKRVLPDKINFLDIGAELSEGSNPEFDRMKFWNSIFAINSNYVNNVYK